MLTFAKNLPFFFVAPQKYLFLYHLQSLLNKTFATRNICQYTAAIQKYKKIITRLDEYVYFYRNDGIVESYPKSYFAALVTINFVSPCTHNTNMGISKNCFCSKKMYCSH